VSLYYNLRGCKNKLQLIMRVRTLEGNGSMKLQWPINQGEFPEATPSNSSTMNLPASSENVARANNCWLCLHQSWMFSMVCGTLIRGDHPTCRRSLVKSVT